MHVKNWSALLWFGLAGVGCGGLQGDELSGGPSPAEALPAATVEDDSREVSAQACPPGVAYRVADILPPGPGGLVGDLTNVQGTLFFVTNVLETGFTLWRSNGTQAGTVPVKVFPANQPYAPPTGLVAVGNKLFFQAGNQNTTGTELWVSDGTESGTHLVKDITPGAQGSWLENATELNGRLVFFRWVEVAPSEWRPELWRSDGTANGTVRVRDFTSFAGSNRFVLKAGNALVFFFSEQTGTTMWRTDGTTAGTTAVKRLDAGPTPISQEGLPGDPALFILDDGPDYEVWKTNGTAEGTLRLESFGRPVRLLGTLGAYVYLTSVDSPVTKRLRIDRLNLSGGGKTGITTLPNPYASDDVYPSWQKAVVSGNDIYFSVAFYEDRPAPVHVELWATNGTAAGTRKLYNNLFTGDEYWSPVFATGTGQVLFGAVPQENGGAIPYFTRGSVATQGRLANVTQPDWLTRVGNRIFFTAYANTEARQLWAVPATFSCPPGPTAAAE